MTHITRPFPERYLTDEEKKRLAAEIAAKIIDSFDDEECVEDELSLREVPKWKEEVKRKSSDLILGCALGKYSAKNIAAAAVIFASRETEFPIPWRRIHQFPGYASTNPGRLGKETGMYRRRKPKGHVVKMDDAEYDAYLKWKSSP